MMQQVAAPLSSVAADSGNRQPTSNQGQSDGFSAFLKSSQQESQRSQPEGTRAPERDTRQPAETADTPRQSPSSDDSSANRTRQASASEASERAKGEDAPVETAQTSSTEAPVDNNGKAEQSDKSANLGQSDEKQKGEGDTPVSSKGADEAVLTEYLEADDLALSSLLQQLEVKDEPLKIHVPIEESDSEQANVTKTRLSSNLVRDSGGDSGGDGLGDTNRGANQAQVEPKLEISVLAEGDKEDPTININEELIGELPPAILAPAADAESQIDQSTDTEVLEALDTAAFEARLQSDVSPADNDIPKDNTQAIQPGRESGTKVSVLLNQLEPLAAEGNAQIPGVGDLSPIAAEVIELVPAEQQAALSQWLSQLNQTLNQQGGEKAVAAAKDFVATLKVALQELNSQQAQGHVAGIDLDSIAKELTTKWGDNGTLPQSDVLRLQQVLIEANKGTQSEQRNQGLERQAAELSAITGIGGDEVASRQIEQRSQAQVSMDRPVNITRNEGLRQLADKVNVMVNQKNMTAEIRIDPPDLGAMKINIAMNGEQATVNFTVQNQQARDALQQGESQLKEMLQEQGIQLGQSSVEQGDGQQKEGEQSGQFASSDGNEDEALESNTEITRAQMVRPGGIDDFA